MADANPRTYVDPRWVLLLATGCLSHCRTSVSLPVAPSFPRRTPVRRVGPEVELRKGPDRHAGAHVPSAAPVPVRPLRSCRRQVVRGSWRPGARRPVRDEPSPPAAERTQRPAPPLASSSCGVAPVGKPDAADRWKVRSAVDGLLGRAAYLSDVDGRPAVYDQLVRPAYQGGRFNAARSVNSWCGRSSISWPPAPGPGSSIPTSGAARPCSRLRSWAPAPWVSTRRPCACSSPG